MFYIQLRRESFIQTRGRHGSVAQPQPRRRETLDTARAAEPLEYVRFRHRNLAQGESFADNSGDLNSVWSCSVGKATVRCGDETFEAIGERMSVFEQTPPYAVYLPNGTDYSVEAITDVELGICGAPGHGKHVATAD